MPCSDTMNYPNFWQESPAERALKERLDIVTKLLYGVVTHVRDCGGATGITELTDNITGLKQWVHEHDAIDAAREAAKQLEIARQNARKSGLKKLTDLERQALGI